MLSSRRRNIFPGNLPGRQGLLAAELGWGSIPTSSVALAKQLQKPPTCAAAQRDKNNP